MQIMDQYVLKLTAQTLLAFVGSFLSLLLIGGVQQWIDQKWS